MKTARDIINTIGPAAIEAALGVKYKSINRASNTGEIPASWFDELEKLCDAEGIKCPREVFSFKSAGGAV